MHLKWLCMIMNKCFLVAISLLLCFSSCGCSQKERELPEIEPEVKPFTRYNADLSFKSTLLNRNVKYDILLPADYQENPEKRYPVMFCFHGLGDNNNSWNGQYMSIENKIKGLEHFGLESMIYVFPYGWNTYWCDRYDGQFPYMTMLATELVPLIDEKYRTIANREHRGVIGYSMGGFGAMVTAMKHPELFSMSAPLSISFRTDEQYMSESQSGWDNQWGSVFGGVGQSGEGRLTAYYKAHCPLHQFTAENKDKYSSVHWFITCGDNEAQLLIPNDDLHTLMRENGYAHEYRVGDGGHSSSYWKSALDEILPYFSFLMAGGSTWDKNLKTPNVPEGFNLNEDGVAPSENYSASSAEGVALYVAYKNRDDADIKDALAILQRGSSAKKFVLIPCNLAKKSLVEWYNYFHDIYPAQSVFALGIGDAADEVMEAQSLFGALFFENAHITTAIKIDQQKFYFIGQDDDNPNYKTSNALYKACKLGDTSFEYRCRNTVTPERINFLTGMEYVRSEFVNHL